MLKGDLLEADVLGGFWVAVVGQRVGGVQAVTKKHFLLSLLIRALTPS